MGRRARLLTLIAMPLMVSAPGGFPSVWAQGAPAQEARETAAKAPATREAIARARRALQAGHGDEATSILETAYQASGDPALLFELGELHEKAGRTVEAKRVFEAYLKRAPNGPARPVVERRLRELELGKHESPRAGAAPPSVGSSTAPAAAPIPAPAVPVSPAPPPASKSTEASPVPGPPLPAAISAPHEPASASARPELAPPPAAAEPERVAPAPLPPRVSAPSAPVLSAPTPAETTAVTTLAAQPSETVAGHEDLPLPRWIPWSGAVVTAGLLTGAIVTGLSAGHRYDDLKSSCGSTVAGCGNAEIDDVRSKARTANILWGAAALVGVATGVAIYVDARAGGVSKLWSF